MKDVLKENILDFSSNSQYSPNFYHENNSLLQLMLDSAWYDDTITVEASGNHDGNRN